MTEEPTSAPKTETFMTFDELIAEHAGDIAAICMEFDVSYDEAVEGVRWIFDKTRVLFTDVSWAINVYRYNVKYDRAAEKILAQYKGCQISHELAERIAKYEDEDSVCTNCDGKTCPKLIQFKRHSVSVVNGEVKLNPNDICSYEKERRLRRKIEKAQIPPRYAGLTFDDYTTDASNQNAVNWAKRTVKNPETSLFITGGAGTGKTFLAAIVAQELTKAGKSVLFVDTPNLLDNLRKTFNQKSSDGDATLDEMMTALSAADVLILDDLGVENPTNWVAERVYLIINNRYNADKPVIVTSNFGYSGLMNRFSDEITGARIVSRLQQMCKLAEINGTDRRIRRKEHG